MEDVLPLSIRNLCEFLLRRGSIDSRFSGLDRAGEGTRIHRRLQKQGGKAYKAELPLQIEMQADDLNYRLSGRADGVFESTDGLWVDEIKTLVTPLEHLSEDEHPAHWAQGYCYAHILCRQRGLANCGVQLSYCHAETMEVKRFTRRLSATELEEFVQNLLVQYGRWARFRLEWDEKRNASLRQLAFPFPEYRGGQRQMAIASYNAFKDGGRLFSCAPTGIGKTISVLFPALKALGEGHGQRIFYLTARTVARRAAEETLERLRASQPLSLLSLTLTAKDKICFLEERLCQPDACPYANGYYDRINDAVYAILNQNTPFHRQDIENAAQKYQLCPYELSLDLALWCDCVICDYNYLFDPVVRLQRFFEGGGGDYLFLVDEAHNLVDRSREMFSARLDKQSFFSFKKELPKQYTSLHRALAGLNRGFLALGRKAGETAQAVLRQRELPAELEKPLEKFTAETEIFLEKHRGSPFEDTLLELYFEALFYQRIAEQFGSHYLTLVYSGRQNTTVRLFCLDPSVYLDECLALGRAAVLFSATLLPLPYYRETLGGGETALLQNLQSPFSPQHLGLYVASGISTKYAQRETTLPAVADMLATLASAKTGNYIAYFPSYQYLRQAADCLRQHHPSLTLLVQEGGMDEEARDAFLARFQPEAGQTLLGLCVLGGIFAEGIDLPGNRLIGVAVVGVGLPQIGPEPDSIRDYYNEKNGHGFEYAYQFPGMNKVLQAVGRVIRTPGDKGVALLIDSRFATRPYQELFPAHWGHWRAVNAQTISGELQQFWQSNSN